MTVPLPDRATLDAAKQRAAEERAFWDSHRAELTQRFPNELVALRNGQVIDHDPNLMTLARRLEERGIPLHEVSIAHMATEPECYLL